MELTIKIAMPQMTQTNQQKRIIEDLVEAIQEIEKEHSVTCTLLGVTFG